MGLNRMSLLAASQARIPFGIKYANPTTLPATTCNGVAFSPAGDAIAVCTGSTSPFVAAYQWSASGFGARYSNPATLPTTGGAAVADIRFTPSGSHIMVLGASGLYAYPWSFATGWGTPVIYSPGPWLPRAFDISPDGSFVAVGSTESSAPIRIIPWTGTNFGSPVQTFTSTANQILDVKFSPDGNYFAVTADSGTSTEGILIFPFSQGTVGTRYLVPSSSNYAHRLAFDQSSNFFVSGKGVRAKSGSSGYTTAVPTGSIPIATPTTIAFSPDNQILIWCTGTTRPYAQAYFWSSGAIRYRLGDPDVPIPGLIGSPRGASFSPFGDVAFAHTNSPFLSVYKTITL